MKSPIITLFQKIISSFDLVELNLPIINILIGYGIAGKITGTKDPNDLIHPVLFFIFLELGSQYYKFFRDEFSDPPAQKQEAKDRGAVILLIVLFFALSILPFSQIFLSQKSSSSSLMIIAVAAFLSVIWRNVGGNPNLKLLPIFLFLINNSFFLPLSQLAMEGVNTNHTFISISQVLFLMLLGFFLVREIVLVEIDQELNPIVQLVGTIPLLKISAAAMLIGIVLFFLLAFGQPEPELKIYAFLSAGLWTPIFINSIYPNENGKQGLIKTYRMSLLLIAWIYLGLAWYLWMS